VDLLDALPLQPPQLRFDHPDTHGLAAHLDAVMGAQVLAGQRGAEAGIHLAAQNLVCLLLALFVHLAVGSQAS
jgi:hypothetical protein